MTFKRAVLWSLGGFLIIVGALLAVGGAWLASLGGSLYYLPAGLGCLADGTEAGHQAWKLLMEEEKDG